MAAVLTLVLALSGAPVAAAASAKDWPLTHELSVDLERRHAEAAGRMSALLGTVERLRSAYRGSADPKGALASWTKELDAVGPVAAQVWDLHLKHRTAMGETDRHLIVWSLGYAKTKDPSYLRSSPEYQALNARNKDIDIRTDGLMRRYKSEQERHKEAVVDLASRLEHEAEARWLYAAVAAGGLFLAAVAAYVLMQPKAPSAPKTEPTSQVIHLRPKG